MIEVRNLTKQYENVTAVDNISFDIQKGEIVGFLGPNGAGKTTTMRMLTCFMPATSGTAKIAGYDIFENPLEIKKRVGYMPETPPLYPEMTVSSYLDYAATLKGVASSNKKAALTRVIEKCHLTSVQNRIIGNLSKGFRQRVGLAQALVHDPEVLILDEPTVGLDPKQIIDIRQLIKELGKEHTVILSTHILPEVTQTCQKVIIINEGKIVAIDTYDELSAQLRKTNKIELRLKKTAGIEKMLSPIDGVLNVTLSDQGAGWVDVETKVDENIQSEISRAVVKGDFGLLEMKLTDVTLEDIFLKLTTEG